MCKAYACTAFVVCFEVKYRVQPLQNGRKRLNRAFGLASFRSTNSFTYVHIRILRVALLYCGQQFAELAEFFSYLFFITLMFLVLRHLEPLFFHLSKMNINDF